MAVLRLLTEGEIETIYHNHLIQDFPPQEVKPLSRILSMKKENHCFCYGLFEEETLLSYAFFIHITAASCCPEKDTAPFSTWLLLDYLAVTADCRGKGIGSQMLALLKESLSPQSLVFIEAEHPKKAKNEQELATRQSRLRFYQHNHCQLTPLTSIVYGVDYCILVNRDEQAFSKDYLENALTAIYQYMFSSPEVWEIDGMAMEP